MPTHYENLGISRTATITEIDAAFKKLAFQWHPDRCKHRSAETKFKRINEARQVLLDPKRRAEYDAALAVAAPAQPSADPYAEWIRAQTREAPEHSRPPHASSRARHHATPRSPPREQLNGVLRIKFFMALCGGEVQLTIGGLQDVPFKVSIAPGTRTGETIVVPVFGIEGNRAADVAFMFEVEEHPLFWINEENDLCTKVPLTVPEWIRGAYIPIPTGYGTKLVRIPPAMAPGREIRVIRHGIPRYESDLVVSIEVALPQNADDVLDDLQQRGYPEDVRKGMNK